MAFRRSSTTVLSRQSEFLLASLLLSLGFAPLACGGTVATASEGEGGGGPEQAGANSVGGTPLQAGAFSGGGAASGGVSNAGGASAVELCPNPTLDRVSQLTVCSNGLEHRSRPPTCKYQAPPVKEGNAGAAGEGGATGQFSPCFDDEDCASVPLAYCDNPGIGGLEAPVCRKGCITDSDCERGVCACNGTYAGHCLEAGCTTDADCGPGSLCALVSGSCGASSFECTTPEDECRRNADCERGDCAMSDGHRVCTGSVCGRPFLVAEVPRLASLEIREDWLGAEACPDMSELSPLERAELAAHWARLGQMEHASIAAFARFTLQLLALGAPSELVESCSRAMADETAHARACFALASAYGGNKVGPGPLDAEHCLEEMGLVAIAKLVLREGCLGETVAALEALAASDVARDPVVKRALARIAQDELRHSQLAFEFLRWAITQASPEERQELAQESARQLASFERDVPPPGGRLLSNERLAAHGLVAADGQRATQLAAVRDVSRPLLAALFATEARTARRGTEWSADSAC